MTPEALIAAMEATWPPAGRVRLGPVLLREGQGGGSEDQGGAAGMEDQRAGGQGGGAGVVGRAVGRARESCGVEDGVHRGRRRGTEAGHRPGVLKPPVILAAAPGAGAVSGGQGDGLVEKEELGPGAGAHWDAADVPPGQAAGDPGPGAPPGAAERPVGAMQDASVAGQHAARGVGDDLARGQDAVLQRHGD